MLRISTHFSLFCGSGHENEVLPCFGNKSMMWNIMSDKFIGFKPKLNVDWLSNWPISKMADLGNASHYTRWARFTFKLLIKSFFVKCFTRAWYEILPTTTPWHLILNELLIDYQIDRFQKWRIRATRPTTLYLLILHLNSWLNIFCQLFYKSMVWNIANSKFIAFDFKWAVDWSSNWPITKMADLVNASQLTLKLFALFNINWIDFCGIFYKSMIRNITSLKLNPFEWKSAAGFHIKSTIFRKLRMWATRPTALQKLHSVRFESILTNFCEMCYKSMTRNIIENIFIVRKSGFNSTTE